MVDKYLLEEPTILSRILRKLKLIGIVISVFFVIVSLLAMAIISSGKDLNKEAKEYFFERSPDLITVFTGDTGRIKFALDLSKQLKQDSIFITGVYSKNTVKSILKLNGVSEDEGTDHIRLDYSAQNTFENVLFTLRYLYQDKGVKKVLITSHDYHLPRIKMIVESMNTTKFDFYYMGLESDFKSIRGLKLLYKEVFKTFRTYAFLLFLDTDIEKQDS